ncbi:hypothetical protein TcasGA2_TC031798 [Tribolium castaneum]|uniref:Uncharacterized protein n=1 Tax=Tribolium castaneum TaxID=7070 RepID=A0A139WAE0_TRICA|nr:hypothetical protein TcasGA2_TC031798 [Tribolium castaneum]
MKKNDDHRKENDRRPLLYIRWHFFKKDCKDIFLIICGSAVIFLILLYFLPYRLFSA